MDTAPVRPTFKLSNLKRVAYAMSVSTGGLGQVLYLGEEFGGQHWHYLAAVGLAGFAEVVMSASGDASLEHRVNRRAWKAMLVLSIVVCVYAASMQFLHFWSENPALAATFGGASAIGFLLHIVDGHILAAAYLRDLARWEARELTTDAAPTLAPRAPRPATVVVQRQTPAPSVVAAEVPAAVKPAPEPKPANVTELHPEQGSKKDRGQAWLIQQVVQHQRNPETVTAAEVDRAIDANGYSKKHIAEWRAAATAALAARAVNE